jgi:hypothetical protein
LTDFDVSIYKFLIENHEATVTEIADGLSTSRQAVDYSLRMKLVYWGLVGAYEFSRKPDTRGRPEAAQYYRDVLDRHPRIRKGTTLFQAVPTNPMWDLHADLMLLAHQAYFSGISVEKGDLEEEDVLSDVAAGIDEIVSKWSIASGIPLDQSGWIFDTTTSED